MKYIILFIVGLIIGAVGHEYDIVRSCDTVGETKSTVWFAQSLTCEVKND